MKILIYQDFKGHEPFSNWLKKLKDKNSAIRIRDRINRIEEFGNLGDFKYLSDNVYELRFHFGSGYRVYFCYEGNEIIILLGGGDKDSQSRDISLAKKIYKELQNEK